MEGRSTESTPDISVIIVNWNLKDLLRDCLKSLEKSISGLAVETIVVDNASTDRSVAMVEKEFPWVCLLKNSKNAGFARAVNQAMKQARGRYLFFLNNDAFLSAGALEKLMEFMDAHPEVGICGPRVVNQDGTLQERAKGRFPSLKTALAHFFLPGKLQVRGQRVLGIYDETGSPEPRTVDWVSGCALMARQEAVASVGMLDARVFMYFEDVDWCYRMQRSGWKVYHVPDAVIMHYGGRSMKQQTGRVVAAHAAGMMNFYAKYHGAAATAVFRLVLWWGYSLKAIGWVLAAITGRSSGFNKLRRMLNVKKTDSSG